jgi:DNA segregation ATPase FtsK/SpoIIIE-like protein
VKKRDDLANHIGHDRSFAVTSSPFSSAAAFILPHTERAFVYMSDMAQDLKVFAQTAQLPMVFGKDMEGKPILVDLAKLPHLLVAGATGSGKSVFINGLLTSLASTRSPQQVQFLLIDPKMVEFTMYTGLPHLISPPVTDPKRAALTLKKLVVEMEKRYQRFAEAGVRNLLQYNRNHPQDQMPYIVTVIDEYADLMVIARADVEETVQRLTQMGRAAGLHLILGTQRPSVDVVTGVIKSNLPSRVAFHLLSVYDFKTVMDTGGPHLLGGGDGICMLNGGGQKRFQSAAISADDDETTRYIEELKRYWRNELRLRKVEPETRVDEDSSLLSVIVDEEVNEPIDGKDEPDGPTPLSVAPLGEWADLEEEEVPPIRAFTIRSFD